MKVKDLISLLKDCPPEHEIYCNTATGNAEDIFLKGEIFFLTEDETCVVIVHKEEIDEG